ncbi:hypothetical protein ECZU31_18180 [Escherichia coli]|nr:hypothetical protein ECZU31_18180 [Escherichia coli]
MPCRQQIQHEQVFKIVGAVFAFELLRVPAQLFTSGHVRTEKPTGKGVMTDVDFTRSAALARPRLNSSPDQNG